MVSGKVSPKALSDLKVLDLGCYISGPFCSKLLAGLGAQTIKVENPKGGDPARKLPPFFKDRPHLEGSGLFLYLNTNKKSITLNLKSATGVKIFRELTKWADIVVENFEPRVMAGLGLDYNSLEKINPGLVMTSISNFGQTGPYRDYKATDIVEYALGGLMYVSGEPGREPLKHGGSQAQYQAGLNAFVATLAAAYMAKETGVGQQVDISIMEVINSIDEYGLITWEYQKQEHERRGNIGGSYPTGLFFCKDGYVGMMVVGKWWRRLVDWMGVPELADEKFASVESRLANRDECDALLFPWLLQHTKEELYHSAQSRGIPFALVRSVPDLLDSPQYRARGFWVDIDHPVTGKLTYPGAPATMSETPFQIERAPLLGEHNQEVYGNLLGYSNQDLVRLAGEGII